VLALQGPDSARVLERHLGAPPGVAYFGFRAATLAGVPVTIGRLGYSGELGYELIVPGDAAPALWRRLAADARECGFDAANSLRVEAGYILFTHELARRVTPFELGLERLLDFDGRAFAGRQAVRTQRWREPALRLVGLEPLGRRDRSALAGVPRSEPTSRLRSPIFGRELALGFVPAGAAAPGTRVAIADAEVGRVCRLPFYDPARALPRRES
jgi:aminomethyltransferase